MRKPRLKIIDFPAVYHCISRVAGGEFLLDDPAKEAIRRILWQQSEFCGVQIITYSILSNHFHVLIRVPDRSIEIPDAELVRRAGLLYAPESQFLVGLRECLAEQGRLPTAVRKRLSDRMGDVSVFMQELKQRITRRYNKAHERYGTLWAERFKSLLVEDDPVAVGAVAAYIDLNAVRALLVGDPKDYRFCGYGEAAAGNAKAQAGLMSFLGTESWTEAGAQYRQQLFLGAGNSGDSGKAVLGRDEILKVLSLQGRIDYWQALRLRIRYLTDGVALGSESYINQLFGQFRDRFGPNRRTGARKLRALPFESLRTFRDLRVRVIS